MGREGRGGKVGGHTHLLSTVACIFTYLHCRIYCYCCQYPVMGGSKRVFWCYFEEFWYDNVLGLVIGTFNVQLDQFVNNICTLILIYIEIFFFFLKKFEDIENVLSDKNRLIFKKLWRVEVLEIFEFFCFIFSTFCRNHFWDRF